MNEIKYEPLYGLQKPFDDGPEDAEAYGIFGNEVIYYKIDKTSVYCFDTDNQWSHVDGAPNVPFLAMRRIIPEPKRWTWEDKKVGRLPEVGAKCRQGHKDEIVIAVTEKFVVTECQNMSVCTTRKDVFMRSYNPIETPEEKAERLREEWCIKALSSCSILSGMQNYELKRLGGYIKDIYDALLSGDLSTPKRKELINYYELNKKDTKNGNKPRHK